jgi:ATP-binding cassette subfamily B protein
MAQSRLQKLGSYLRPHWRQTTLGILALLIVNAVGVYIPWLIGNIVDKLRLTFSFEQVLRYVVLIILLSCVMWVIRMVSRTALFGVGRQVGI